MTIAHWAVRDACVLTMNKSQPRVEAAAVDGAHILASGARI